MEPMTGIATFVGVGGLLALARIVYNYGRDRKELNGTVERVKKIEYKLDEHMADEAQDFKAIHKELTRVSTKLDLVLDNRITKHG